MSDISYNIIRRPRRSTVGIVIRANNAIEVLAPACVPEKEIARLVLGKAGWIRKKLQLNAEVLARRQPRSFGDGEALPLAGRSLRLRVESGRTAVCVDGDELVVRLPRYEPARRERLIRNQLAGWYKQQALAHLEQRVRHYAAVIGRAPAHTGVKGYKSRWGSCHQDGRIYFNWRIVMAPQPVIDYVVVHELCHLIEHNHSPAYWRLVESVMPGFRDAKRWLQVNGPTLEL